jgi:hypothetical protein
MNKRGRSGDGEIVIQQIPLLGGARGGFLHRLKDRKSDYAKASSDKG